MGERHGNLRSRREFLRTVAAATGVGGGMLASQARAAAPNVGAGATRPNILFFLPDQHRFDWLGSNPDIPVPTPNLEALGKAGVHFARAISPA